MPKEILIIPVEHIKDTIRIIRTGLSNTPDTEAHEPLRNWCKEMEDKE